MTGALVGAAILVGVVAAVVCVSGAREELVDPESTSHPERVLSRRPAVMLALLLALEGALLVLLDFIAIGTLATIAAAWYGLMTRERRHWAPPSSGQ